MNTDNKTDQEPKPTADDVRAEYTALARYFGQVIGFRFTAATIYFAGIAFILQAGLSRSKLVLMLIFSIGMWIVEIRNRGIFYVLGARGMQIERDYWGYKDKLAYSSFFQRMFRAEPLKGPAEDTEKPAPDPVRILIWMCTEPPRWIEKLISHTMGFDLVYLGVIVFSLWHLGLRGWLLRLL